MTSQRQRDTNRHNASMSTGPRTPNGKARASQNARKHGLAAPLGGAAVQSDEVESLAHAMAGHTIDERRLELARIAATATLELVRVRAHKVSMIDDMLRRAADDDLADSAELDSVEIDDQPTNADPGMPLSELLAKFIRFDRYERRALSRRKKALRDLGNRPAPE